MINMKQKTKINMVIDITYDYKKIKEEELGFSISSLTKELLLTTCFFLKIKYDFLVSLLICTNYKIKNINKKFRNIDKATDVLSFPNIIYKKVAKINKKDIVDYTDKDTKQIYLGDIVISMDKCISQSKKYGHSLKREFSFLYVHSLLHLFGYDHIDKIEQKSMFDMQNKILNSVGINR